MKHRAIVSFAVGDFARLSEITFPRFESYSKRHGYDFIIPSAEGDRPPSWRKLPILLQLIDDFDELLWIDADVLIVDDSKDLAHEVPDDMIHALVFHRIASGSVIPNCGVWLIRPAIAAWLEQAWRREDLIYHYWWEQAAIIELLGYRLDGPHRVETISPNILNDFHRSTARLDNGWNDHPYDVTYREVTRFVHPVGTVETKMDRLKQLIRV